MLFGGSWVRLKNGRSVEEVSEDIYAFDGFKNTSSFKLDAEKDTIRQPAIDLVWEYEAGGLRGWYIGSVAQHEALYENLDIVNETFFQDRGKYIVWFVLDFYRRCGFTQLSCVGFLLL